MTDFHHAFVLPVAATHTACPAGYLVLFAPDWLMLLLLVLLFLQPTGHPTQPHNHPVAFGFSHFSQDYDLAGDYIKTWVPELARVPPSRIHEPWLMSKEDQEK